MKTPVNNQTKLLTMKNLQLLFDSITKKARTAPTWGIEVGVLNRRSMLKILMYFALGLI